MPPFAGRHGESDDRVRLCACSWPLHQEWPGRQSSSDEGVYFVRFVVPRGAGPSRFSTSRMCRVVLSTVSGLRLIRVDPHPHQGLGEFRIIGGRLAADSRVALVSSAAVDRESDHFEHAGVPFVEIECDDLGIPVHSQNQLSEIVGADVPHGEWRRTSRRRGHSFFRDD